VLSFAGLWDRWKNSETGEAVISCTITVTDANELTRPIHDRMPVVLDRADIGRWLSGEAGTELLKPAGKNRLRMWPVSRRVNKTGTGDDDPTLLEEWLRDACVKPATLGRGNISASSRLFESAMAPASRFTTRGAVDIRLLQRR